MAVKPLPVLITCPKCGWKTTFAPRSDAFIHPPPSVCAKCGNPDLKSSLAPPGVLDRVMSVLLGR